MKRNKRKPLCIGVTGGIGSGKSALAKTVAKRLPVRVIFADEVGRELMEPGKSVYKALVAVYGNKVLASDGSLDRQKIAALCFSGKEEQERINAIEHPLIRDEIEKRIERTRKPAVLLEAALLEEGGLVPLCDEVVHVTASREIRILRLLENRGYTREKAEAILALQKTETDFEKIATIKVDNSGKLEDASAKLEAFLKSRI